MSAQAQNTQPATNLGRGKRKRTQTERGQAYRNALSVAASTQRAPNVQTQSPAVVATTQPAAPAQSQAHSAQTQPQNTQSLTRTQAQPQTSAPSVRRSTRLQNNTRPSGGSNASANSTRGQPTKSSRGTQPAPQVSSRQPTSKVKINALMIQIYEEIHHAATDHLSTISSEIYDVRLFLLGARLRRFLDLLANTDRQTIENQLRNYDIHSFRAGDVVGDAQNALDQFSEPDRLTEFLNNPKMLLLTFCAHSPSFRGVINRSDDDSKRNKLPYWSEIYPLIKDCTSSLELFARSYIFDWHSHLRAFEKHCETVLREVYNDNQKAVGGALEGVNHWNLGIADGDLDEIHNIPDGEEFHVHHHWALPKEDKQPAVRPSIEYTVTTSGCNPQHHPFVNDYYTIVDRPKPRNRGRPRKRPFVKLPLNSHQTLNQLDITRPVILNSGLHQWPNDASNNVLGVEDFCGAPGHPCQACGVAAPDPMQPMDPMDSEDDMVVVSNKSTYPCHCTLADLMAKNTDPFKNPDDLLVELFTTEHKGRGVRALQHMPKGTIVGNYIGEVYPETELGIDVQVDRYGAPEGNGYHFTVDVGPPPNPDNNAKFSIDSAHLGNWTRFMNHSCDANVTYDLINLGQRWTTVCKTTRIVKFQDEMMTDYGDQYFIYRNLVCRCGSKKCEWTAQKLAKEIKQRKRDEEGDESEEDVSESDQPRKRSRKRSKQTAKKSKAAKKGGRRR